jgi:hypothetical protein
VDFKERGCEGMEWINLDSENIVEYCEDGDFYIWIICESLEIF